MASNNVYEYLVIKRDAKDSSKDQLVVEPTTVMAPNEKIAYLAAARAVKAEDAADLSALDIQVRPF